uniref:Uncharacterized protein n=1 Tax=Meloidogyne hapla TaxID=6305 RepID=A0A1I8BJN3_MELHA
MSNSFFVFLESNTTDYPDNQPNKFRVHLPKPLYFSGNWVCGVHSISYPFSWPSTIGTLDEQWMKIHFIDDNSKKNVLRVPVPAASHNSVEALKNYLATTLKHQSDAIGSVERPGAFIAPPSLLRSPPRAEKKIKRSAKESKSPPPYEELRSPPPYLEEEQEKKEKSPSPELGSPPLYIEDENKDRTPSPTREEPTSPPPYLEEKSPEKPSTAPPPIEIVETSPPKPKKERKEEKEKQAQENVTQKAPTSVLSNVGVDKKEEKKEQENTTQKSTNLFNSNSLYAYKTYLSHELSYSAGAKSSHLNSAGYYYDTGTNQQVGSSFTSRKSLFTQSRTAQFVSKLDADIFNQPLYLINHCEVDIEILPNDTRFVLIAPPTPPALTQSTNYHFEVVSCKLYVKKVELMDGLALDITRKLDTKPARYAVRKTLMKQLFISHGRYEFNSNI